MEAIPTMEAIRITTVAPRMGMEMEEATDITVPTQQHPPGRIKVTLLVSSAGRLDTTPPNAPKQRMEMAMEVLGRSPTLLTEDR